ncbi:MAG TPA: hypothetical protein VFU47_15150 [Armatimonadota bacterium]|nr:hypothetical protein [Armatimonadota bacterium]
MPRCDICGHHLRVRELAANLLRLHRPSYPFQTVTGTRSELSVRRLCAGCALRARQLRLEQQPASNRPESRTGA